MAARWVATREVEVLRWAAAGRSDGDIAAGLGISTRTAQKHLERSFRKLAVRTRADAARLVWTLVADRVGHAELPRATTLRLWLPFAAARRGVRVA